MIGYFTTEAFMGFGCFVRYRQKRKNIDNFLCIYYNIYRKRKDFPKGYQSVEIQICQELLMNSSNQLRISVIVHEIGHLFGLIDYETAEGTLLGDNSLMSYARNRENIYTPQSFDIRNVLYQYE